MCFIWPLAVCSFTSQSLLLFVPMLKKCLNKFSLILALCARSKSCFNGGKEKKTKQRKSPSFLTSRLYVKKYHGLSSTFSRVLCGRALFFLIVCLFVCLFYFCFCIFGWGEGRYFCGYRVSLGVNLQSVPPTTKLSDTISFENIHWAHAYQKESIMARHMPPDKLFASIVSQQGKKTDRKRDSKKRKKGE